MMKIKSIINTVSLTIVAAGLLASCIPQDEIDRNLEAAILEVSQQSLELTSKGIEIGHTPLITIKTNQPVVKAVSLDPGWLNVVCRNNGIYVSADENKTGVARKTSILVVAGGEKELIEVTQSNARVFLDVSPKDVELVPDGESLLIDVRSNGADWSFEVEDSKEWLKATRIGGIIQVVAEPNRTLKARSAQIYVSLSGEVMVVNFSQRPRRKDAKYALPLLERYASPYDVIAFEEKNGNYLLEYLSGGGLLGQPSTASVKFVYASSIYSDVVYTIDASSRLVKEIVISSREPEALQSKEFLDFLSDSGFSISNNTTDKTSNILTFSGSNSEAAYGLSMKIYKDNSKASKITFKSRGRQSEPYKTFEVFPFDKYEYLFDGWTYAKIKANELSEGSKIDYETPSEKHPNIIKESQYTVAEGNKPLVARIFGMNDDKIDPATGKIADKLDQLVAVFDDVHLGSFVSEGKYYLTEEFQNLLNASGFRYVKETNGLTQWYNDEKKILIIPRGTRFSSVMDLMPVLAISYFHRDLSIQTTAEREATFSMAYEEVLRQDKLLGAK